MTSLSLPAVSPTALNFSVVDRDCRDFSLVVDTFKKLIAPIYGEQQKALGKIGGGSDRLCEMLYDNKEAKGLIVYKKELNERKALELKTLVVLNPEKDSGKGYGSVLISRIVEIAHSRFAQAIEVTVSSKKPEALVFFQKKQFVIHSSVRDFYQKGDTETFLYRDLKDKLSSGVVSASMASPVPKKTIIPLPITQKSSLAPSTDRTFGCTLKGEYVRQIQLGQKTYEGRINSGAFQSYKIGDKVNWFAGQELRVLTEIIDIRVFRTFEEMLTAVGYKKMLPSARSLEEAVAAYNSIPSYPERARASGVVAFGVKPILDTRQESIAQGSSSLAGVKRLRGES